MIVTVENRSKMVSGNTAGARAINAVDDSCVEWHHASVAHGVGGDIGTDSRAKPTNRCKAISGPCSNEGITPTVLMHDAGLSKLCIFLIAASWLLMAPLPGVAQPPDSSQHPFATLPPDVAKRLTSLTADVAKQLVEPPFKIGDKDYSMHHLEFTQLAELEPEVARILAGNGGSLTFPAMTDLTPAVASAFKEHDGYISFPRISRLSAESAKALAEHKGKISLESLEKLECVALAKKLYVVGDVRFTELSPEVAEALSADKEASPLLSLPNLKTLSPDVAKGLAQNSARLALDGLEEVSPEVAAQLGKHRGFSLGLLGLKQIDRRAALALSQHQRELALGIEVLDVEAAQALAGHVGDGLLLPKLKEMSLPVAQALSLHKGGVKNNARLVLPRLQSLSPEVAEALARYEGRLRLTGIRELPLSVAEQLARFRGTDLRVGCLPLLTADAAKAIANIESGLELSSNDDECTISPSVAAALAKHKGSLSLLGMTSMGAAVAGELAKHSGPLLLDSLRELSPGVLAALANHRGTLSLCGLEQQLTLGDAQTLLKRDGTLQVPVKACVHDLRVWNLLGNEKSVSIEPESGLIYKTLLKP